MVKLESSKLFRRPCLISLLKTDPQEEFTAGIKRNPPSIRFDGLTQFLAQFRAIAPLQVEREAAVEAALASQATRRRWKQLRGVARRGLGACAGGAQEWTCRSKTTSPSSWRC